MIGFARTLTVFALAFLMSFSVGSSLTRSTDMGAMMMASVAGDPHGSMPDGCGDCPGDDPNEMSAADCAAFCAGGLHAILPLPAGLGGASTLALEARAATTLAGRRGEPDPHPPRPS